MNAINSCCLRPALIAAGIVLATFGSACGASGDGDDLFGNGSGGSGPPGTGGDSGVIVPEDGGDGDGAFVVGATMTLHGQVLAPSGAFPISGALVYLTQNPLDFIPHGAYHYECDDMEGTRYTLSNPDGGWVIEDVPVGRWTIVTRKGNFRRAREIDVTQDMDPFIAQDLTSLPRSRTPDDLDVAPSFAVVRTAPDLTYNLLAKFGMGNLANDGSLADGTQTFDIYQETTIGSYPHTRVLFENDLLQNYHMVFLPCNASSVGEDFVNENIQKLQDYVSMGGRIYNSCTVSLWTEAPFPEYIDFNGKDDPVKWDIGRVSPLDYSTNGLVLDEGLAMWLPLVSGANPTSVPFQFGYVKIDSTANVLDGHGLEKDDGVVIPYTWVQDAQKYAGSPLMVTFNYDFGKVFYSVYETSGKNSFLTPQEYVLLYVMLEVGVCENLPPKIASLNVPPAPAP